MKVLWLSLLIMKRWILSPKTGLYALGWYTSSMSLGSHQKPSFVSAIRQHISTGKSSALPGAGIDFPGSVAEHRWQRSWIRKCRLLSLISDKLPLLGGLHELRSSGTEPEFGARLSLDELSRFGVTEVCVARVSRSTPLTLEADANAS